MRCIAVAILLSAAAATPASADYLFSTKELKRVCSSDSEMPSCLSYISGVADQFSFQNEVVGTLTQSGLKGRDCIYARVPKDADAHALRDIVLKYLEKAPHMLENPAVVAVGAALTEAYPCYDRVPSP